MTAMIVLLIRIFALILIPITTSQYRPQYLIPPTPPTPPTLPIPQIQYPPPQSSENLHNPRQVNPRSYPSPHPPDPAPHFLPSMVFSLVPRSISSAGHPFPDVLASSFPSSTTTPPAFPFSDVPSLTPLNSLV